MTQRSYFSPDLSSAYRQRDLDACVRMMRTGSRTFFAASRLLPPRMRSASIALYAFCRVADDLVDEGVSPSDSLAQLSNRLDDIYADRPQPLVEDRALSAVVHQYQLPRPLLDALLEGFTWDAQARRYETIEEVHAYAARVAGSVGAMMCWLMGVRSAYAMARACELGLAMQLTNIARDVGDDARNARLYLPRQWLREAGIDADAWLQAPVCSPALESVVERLLAEADRLYQQSTQGIAELPRDCRSAIMAARLIYAEIGTQLRREGMNPVQRRAVVASSRKLTLLASAWLQSARLRPVASEAEAVEPVDAIRYLVQYCTEASERLQRQASQQPAHAGIPHRSLGERAEWMLELFERQAALRQGRANVRSAYFPAQPGLH